MDRDDVRIEKLFETIIRRLYDEYRYQTRYVDIYNDEIDIILGGSSKAPRLCKPF